MRASVIVLACLALASNAAALPLAGLKRNGIDNLNKLVTSSPGSAATEHPVRYNTGDVDVANVKQRGLLDGSLNNLDIVDHISALNTNINSDASTSEVTNANTRADGKKNNSTY